MYSWGFDCAAPVVTETWSALRAAAGTTPAFVGRYLGDGGGAATPLTAAEVVAIHALGCAILPVYNDSPVNAGAEGSYALGHLDGQRAIAQAQSLGVPAGVYIAADVEYSAPVTADWLRGWADAMRPSPYGGSGIIYCAPDAPSWQAAWAEASAAGDPNIRRLLIWSAQPAERQASVRSVPTWGPLVPPGATVALWQWSEGCAEAPVDLDLCDTSLLQHNPFGSLWLPPAPAGTPQAPPVPDVASARADIAQAQDLLARALAALG